MKNSIIITFLVCLIALLVVIAAAVGLFAQGGNGPFTFTTLHGDVAEIYGRGLYQNDTVLIAVGYRIGDGYMLLVGIPLFLISFWLYRRGTIKGRIMLTGIFMFLLYSYVSLALGAAYNNLLMVYIILTMLTFLGTLGLIISFDQQTYPSLFSERLPRRGISMFLIISGMALFGIWFFVSILPALLAGSVPPELGSYTTMITFVLDMGMIAPLMVAVGILFLRREPLGYVLASAMLIFIDVLGLGLLAMGIGQEIAGLMNIGQFIGLVVSFAILTFVSLGYTASLFRHISEPVSQRAEASARIRANA